MVFYYVCHLRLSYSVYLFFYSSVYMFVLFYGPCCLIQINDDDDDDDDDEFTDLLDHRVCLIDRKPYGNWRRRCRRHRVQVRRTWRRHHHAEVQRRREARHEA